MKFDFEEEIIKVVQKYLPLSEEVVAKKMMGVLWKKTNSDTIILINDSYDNTIFLHGTEGNEQWYDEEKALILTDMYDYVEKAYEHIEKEIDKAVVKYEETYPKAKYMQLYDSWVDMFIKWTYKGVFTGPVMFDDLNIRQFVDINVCAISDEKDFSTKEDILDIE